ncbi:hypothetical protein VNI00_017764 [Paramarasmius palmivorus]|uniref:BZIP domain-containing protein n=1 Tax=Paramarasmius palmivorus TaxID=297713 RepID=A0AAW0B2J4_9AGAR
MARTVAERKAVNRVSAANYRKKNLELTRQSARERMRQRRTLKRNEKDKYGWFDDNGIRQECQQGQISNDTINPSYPPRHRRHADDDQQDDQLQHAPYSSEKQKPLPEPQGLWEEFFSSIHNASRAFRMLAKFSTQFGDSVFLNMPSTLGEPQETYSDRFHDRFRDVVKLVLSEEIGTGDGP